MPSVMDTRSDNCREADEESKSDLEAETRADTPSTPSSQSRNYQGANVESNDRKVERLLLQKVALTIALASRRDGPGSPIIYPAPSLQGRYPSATQRRASEARRSRASSPTASNSGLNHTVTRQDKTPRQAPHQDRKMEEITAQMEQATLADGTIRLPSYPSSETSDVSHEGEDSDDEDDVEIITHSAPVITPLLKPATWSTRELAEGAVHGLTNSLKKISVRSEGRAARRNQVSPY